MIKLSITKRLALAVTALATLAVSGMLAYAQVGGNFNLSWSTVDGGGGTFSSGGQFTLGGSIGQPDAGIQSGGNFSVDGGFWGGAGGQTPSATPHRDRYCYQYNYQDGHRHGHKDEHANQ